MWITEKKLKEFVQSEMRETLQRSGATLESAIAALKDCFTVDNDGNIDVTNSNFELYIGSTVTKGADEKEIAQLTDLVSGLYGVLAEHSAEDLRRFGFLEAAADRTDEALEQLRSDLLDGVHSVMEYQERAEKDRQKALTAAFDEQDRKKLIRARKNLWQIMGELWSGKKDPSYNGKAYDLAGKIKEYGEDPIADFCLIFFAPAFNSNRVKKFLESGVPDNQEDVLFVLRTLLLNYDTKYDVDAWIAACEDGALRDHFRRRYEEEAARFEDGTYDPARDRDVFLAYNHEDEALAWELVRELESPDYGLECFFSVRNLHQSTTWDIDLEKAIEHCRIFLFLSTQHSRAAGSYTHKEIDYVRMLDRQHVGEAKNYPYEKIERKDRTPRVEYLPDGCHYDTKRGYGKDLGEFFKGLTYYSDLADVCERVFDIVKRDRWAQENDRPSEEEKSKAAEEQARRQAEAEAKRKAEEEAKKKAEEEARRKSATETEKNSEDRFQEGLDYYRGKNGKSKDLKKAATCFHNAAEKGHTEAQYMLGYCYEKGEGVEISKKDAFVWYVKAAEKGNDKALFSAGWFYCFGKRYGIDVDEEKGWEYLERSARDGYVTAQYALGYYYERGIVVARSVEKALEWYEKAAENGHVKAKGRTDALKKQIEKADRRKAEKEKAPQAVEAKATQTVRNPAEAARKGEESVAVNRSKRDLLTKYDAIVELRKNNIRGLRIRNTTYTSKNASSGTYRATLLGKHLEKDWCLLLNDPDEACLRLFRVPAGSIAAGSLSRRRDNPSAYDLEICNQDFSYTDRRSGFAFDRFLSDTVKYSRDADAKEEVRSGAPVRQDAQPAAQSTPAPKANKDGLSASSQNADADSTLKIDAAGYVLFGSYPQSKKGDEVKILYLAPGKSNYYVGSDGARYELFKAEYYKVEPIRWRVIARSNGKALLVADRILDTHCFDPKSLFYDKSEIRRWLNGEFYDKAFSEEEKAFVLTTNVDNSPAGINPKKYTYGSRNAHACEPTKDKVFLLSMREVLSKEYGFNEEMYANDPARCHPYTDYVNAKKIKKGLRRSENGFWWLRSPDSFFSNMAQRISMSGARASSDPVGVATNGVVPALWVKV